MANVPNPKFVIIKGKDDQYYFRLTARNGEPIAHSEGYTSKANCLKGIESVKKNGPDAPIDDTTD